MHTGLWVCMLLHVDRHTCVHTCTREGQSWCEESPSITRSSRRQASQSSLVLLASLLWGISFSVFSGYNYTWSTTPTQHLQDFQGSELQALWSSCLCGKCFSHRATCLALHTRIRAVFLLWQRRTMCFDHLFLFHFSKCYPQTKVERIGTIPAILG